MHSWSTFGARANHEQTRIHKIHHSSNLGEATTFPLIVYYVPLHEAPIQMTFFPRRKSGWFLMRGNRGDYWLLMVRTQIANLTFVLSFGHNLCFKCSNGSCEPILYIYVSIAFQWYITLWRFKNPFGTPTPNNGSSLGSVKVHSLTLSHSQELEMWLLLPSWPITLQVLALVVSPRLGLRHNV